MKKLLFAILFALAVVGSLKAQTNRYRELGKSRVMSEKEFENQLKVLKHRINKQGSDLQVLVEIAKRTKLGQDSLFDFKLKLKTPRATADLSRVNDATYAMVGKALPDFTLMGLDGKKYSKKDFAAKPMLINYWFSSCSPCKAEMPALNKLKTRYADKVHFLSITPDNKTTVEQVLAKHPFEFLHLIQAHTLIKKLGIVSAPKNIFVDKDGIIRQVYDKVDDLFDDESQTLLPGDAREFVVLLDRLTNE